MNIKITKTIGKVALEVDIDEKDPKEALSQATFFMQPDYCGLCKEKNIIWTSNKAKTDSGTFTYIKRRCMNGECKATSTMGEYKDGGFFWKQWEIYVPDESKK